MAKVILSSNVTHYQYAAKALHEIGLLNAYHTTYVPVSNDLILPKFLPKKWSQKFNARNIDGVPSSLVKRHLLPELTQLILGRLRKYGLNFDSTLPNRLFDEMVSSSLLNVDVFHFVSGIGVKSSAKSKLLSAMTICDERMEHPCYQNEILKKEHSKFGIAYSFDLDFYVKTAIRGYDNSDFLVVGSSYTKQTYADRGFPEDKIFVIPYGYEKEIFYPSNKSQNQDSFTITFAGQLIPRKGFFYLVEALKKLQDLPGFKVRFMGDDPYSLFDSTIRGTKLESFCEYYGSVSKYKLAEFLRDSSLFVLPSIADSQPLSCLEALGCGCPIIVTERMGTSELIEDGLHGYVVRSSNSTDIADRILELYKNRDVVEKMSSNVRKLASDLTWDAYEDNIKKLYNKIGVS